MKKSEVVVVIPVFNESKTVSAILEKVTKKGYISIAVDDGSVDDSFLKSENADYRLKHILNLGKGAAMKTGADFAFYYLNKKAVIFMDSDGQHSAEDLDKFLKQLGNYSFVTGKRSLTKKMPKYRSIGNFVVTYLVKFLFKGYIEDIPSGFKAIKRRSYKNIRWDSSGYAVELEMCVRALQNKIKTKTIKIETLYLDTDRGMNLLDVLKVAFKLFEFKIRI